MQHMEEEEEVGTRSPYWQVRNYGSKDVAQILPLDNLLTLP